MSKWQRTLDLKDIWGRGENREISPQDFAKEIAKRLKKLKPFNDYVVDDEKEEILLELADFSEYEEADWDDFDNILERIYDWGDISLDGMFGGEKVCWIKTYF